MTNPNILDKLLLHRDACNGVSTDTRAAMEGSMFWALKGERFDANAFVEQALKQGAKHVVCSDTSWSGHEQVTVVGDVLEAMQQLANTYRKRWNCDVLALTGSNGKTTTKELIHTVLRAGFQVHSTKGNLNNHIGVPLTILNAPFQPEFAIVEMGANHQKEIQALCQIAEPTCGYITNIGKAHLEGFGGEQGVYLGKKELFDWLAQTGGKAFVQSQDDKVVEAAQAVDSRVNIPTNDWTWKFDGTQNLVCHQDQRKIEVQLEGSYNLANVVAAISIGEHFGVSWNDIRKAISGYTPENNRSQAVKTSKNWVLLDAYNANPSSMESAIRDFAARSNPHPLVLLGDMAELGKSTAQAHQLVAHCTLDLGLELWTIGEHFGVAREVHPHSDWRHFGAWDDLVHHLQSSPISNRQLLVKGSRSAGLERIMPYL